MPAPCGHTATKCLRPGLEEMTLLTSASIPLGFQPPQQRNSPCAKLFAAAMVFDPCDNPRKEVLPLSSFYRGGKANIISGEGPQLESIRLRLDSGFPDSWSHACSAPVPPSCFVTMIFLRHEIKYVGFTKETTFINLLAEPLWASKRRALWPWGKVWMGDLRSDSFCCSLSAWVNSIFSPAKRGLGAENHRRAGS